MKTISARFHAYYELYIFANLRKLFTCSLFHTTIPSSSFGSKRRITMRQKKEKTGIVEQTFQDNQPTLFLFLASQPTNQLTHPPMHPPTDLEKMWPSTPTECPLVAVMCPFSFQPECCHISGLIPSVRHRSEGLKYPKCSE